MSEKLQQEMVEEDADGFVDDSNPPAEMNGHHQAAPESIPPKVDNNDHDPFGMLGPSPASAPVIAPATATDDDPFGMFASVDAPAPSMPGTESAEAAEVKPVEQPTSPGDDFGGFSTVDPVKEANGDDFGAFDSGGITQTPAENGGDFGSFAIAASSDMNGGQVPTKYDDDFGEFDEAEQSATNGFGDHGEQQPTSNEMETSSSQPTLPAEKDEEDFDAFEEAQPEVVAASKSDGFSNVQESQTNAADVDNDFGSFGDAPAKESVVVGEGPDGVEEEKKELSELDEAQETLPSEAPDEIGAFGDAQQVTPTADDDFGGLSDAVAADETEAKSAPASTDDDDFGDFGGVKETFAPAPEQNDDFGDFGGAKETSALAAEPDNGFGDFGEAHETADAETAEDDFGEAQKTPTTPANGDDDNDAFGDFGEAQQTSPPVAAETDDDFGDFGEAQEAPAPAEEATDDGFGDFGQAQEVQAPTTAAAAADYDDDFGDFGEAEAAPAGGDNDDFGDFGEAQAAPPPATVGDYDDFGDFGEAQEAVAPAAPLPPPTGNPLVDKSRLVFSTAFGGYTLPQTEVNESAGDNDSAVMVSEFLSSLLDSDESSLNNEANSRWSMTRVSSVLDEIEKTKPAAPLVVLNRDATAPYGQYNYPVGGVRREDVAGKLRLLKRLESSRRSSFDESTSSSTGDLPPATFSPINVSKPPTEVAAAVADISPQTTDGPEGLKLDFSDFKAPEEREDGGGGKEGAKSAAQQNGNGKSMSERAKQFLRQIPDISFMLKSELSLSSTSAKS